MCYESSPHGSEGVSEKGCENSTSLASYPTGSVLQVKPLDKLVEATFTLETGGSERSKQIMSYVLVIDANRKPLNPIHREV